MSLVAYDYSVHSQHTPCRYVNKRRRGSERLILLHSLPVTLTLLPISSRADIRFRQNNNVKVEKELSAQFSFFVINMV